MLDGGRLRGFPDRVERLSTHWTDRGGKSSCRGEKVCRELLSTAWNDRFPPLSPLARPAGGGGPASPGSAGVAIE